MSRAAILRLCGVGAAVFVCVFCACLWVASRYQNTTDQRPENQYLSQVTVADADRDADADGIPDGVDIEQGAVQYTRQRPKYASKYYPGGPPTDNYGVCTDLVAAALKNAGYDLQLLVSADIQASPESYQVPTPDSAIDYRRVKNLEPYLRRHADSLTLSLDDIAAWQPGDVVVFDNHVGIISQRRDTRGIPFVIHHESPWQECYEQAILPKRDDLRGHFRMRPDDFNSPRLPGF